MVCWFFAQNGVAGVRPDHHRSRRLTRRRCARALLELPQLLRLRRGASFFRSQRSWRVLGRTPVPAQAVSCLRGRAQLDIEHESFHSTVYVDKAILVRYQHKMLITRTPSRIEVSSIKVDLARC